jgi:hypothetical protein
MLEYALIDEEVTMTDEVQILAQQVAAAEEKYKIAASEFSTADTNLRNLRKKHLEVAAKAAGWEPGIVVIGKLKSLEELPKHLWSAQQTRRQQVRGIYMGARDAAHSFNEVSLDVRWIGSKGQPLKDKVTHTELYHWHRVIDVPKED